MDVRHLSTYPIGGQFGRASSTSYNNRAKPAAWLNLHDVPLTPPTLLIRVSSDTDVSLVGQGLYGHIMAARDEPPLAASAWSVPSGFSRWVSACATQVKARPAHPYTIEISSTFIGCCLHHTDCTASGYRHVNPVEFAATLRPTSNTYFGAVQTSGGCVCRYVPFSLQSAIYSSPPTSPWVRHPSSLDCRLPWQPVLSYGHFS